MAHPFIRLDRISKVFGNGQVKTRVLNDVSLMIDQGEFVSIVGPSGSGKSTLMYILGTLDRPSQGRYFWEGRDVFRLSDDDLAKVRNEKIGFVFQTFNLLARTRSLDNVLMPLIYSRQFPGDKRQRATQVLAQVGLSQKLASFPSQLSGGEQQRVAIARALVADPSLVLADEPTGNLDSHSGDQIIGILKRLNGEGKTIVLVTHNRRIAKESPRVVFLQDGRIIADRRKKS